MHFNPNEYWNDHPNMTIENQTLSNKKLVQYGKQLTKLREKQRQLALQDSNADIVGYGDEIEQVSQLSAKMQRGYFKGYILKEYQSDMLELETPIGARRKTSRKALTPDEVVQICYEVLVLKYFHKDVAKKHNIHIKLISQYICRA